MKEIKGCLFLRAVKFDFQITLKDIYVQINSPLKWNSEGFVNSTVSDSVNVCMQTETVKMALTHANLT